MSHSERASTSTGNLSIPFLLDLAPEILEEVLNRVGETGTAWRVGKTLFISGILFQRASTEADVTTIALLACLGFINEVRLTPYLFEVHDQPHWGLSRWITCLSPNLFHVLQSIIPRKIPIRFDKEIIELRKVGRSWEPWYTTYEKKYNIPLTFPPIDDDGWPIL